MAENYELNEKDISSVVHYLEIHEPENATREKAIAILEDLQTGVHRMAHTNPALLEKLQKELEENAHSDAQTNS
jgi:hypothetical protein